MPIMQRFLGSMAVMGIFWFGLSVWVGTMLRGTGHVNLKGFQGRRLTNMDATEGEYTGRWQIPTVASRASRGGVEKTNPLSSGSVFGSRSRAIGKQD